MTRLIGAACILALALMPPTRAQAVDPSLAPTPPMGWNSWNCFEKEIDEKKIQAIADAMVRSGMREAGYVYLVLDDAWMAKNRDGNGRLQADPEKFPSGMKAIGDYIHSKGLKYGIYQDRGEMTCQQLPGSFGQTPSPDASYAVVVKKSTAEDAQWQKVVAALKTKHNASIITYDGFVDESLNALKQEFPRYTCFVAPPTEATGDFVTQVHQLTRKLDDDPYTDTLWGILTGYDADNALAIASHSEPLVVKKVASGTDFAAEMVTEGQWYDELVKNKHVKKEPGGKAEQLKGPDDTTQALVDLLNDYKPDLMITSGHATQADWQIGFRYRNGQFRSQAGQMYGLDTQNKRIEINSPNPKVYLPIGNCLMGDINGPDAMALAWMNDVGVKQMLGYTKPTWFGYMGWGVLDYFVEQPGRYTLTEAFFANNHALIHRLNDSETPNGDRDGLTFDRDVVAFYGDPKWSAKMAEMPKYYDQKLEIKDGIYTLTITPNRGEDSFKPVNTNGSQRGGRPIVQFLPHRIKDVKIVTGEDLNPVVTDDFILVPNPRKCDPGRTYVVRFKAREFAGTAKLDSSLPERKPIP